MPPPEEYTRLFVAIDPSEAVRKNISELLRPSSLPRARWTPPEQYHLTLRFIGNVPTSSLPDIRKELKTISVEPFIIPITGIGVFPLRGRPRVVWVGVGTGHPRLFQLRQRIDDALLHLGAGDEIRDFHPHMTLARCADTKPVTIERFVHQNEAFDGGDLRVTGFTLYSSVLAADGAVHTPELVVTFKG